MPEANAKHDLVISYVLNNWRRHKEDLGSTKPIDRFSSAISFRGWRERPDGFECPAGHDALPVQDAQSWLLRVGWKEKASPISYYEVPGPVH